MKTIQFWIFGTLIVLLASIASAQGIIPQSDTISYPVDSLKNGRNNIRDFGPLNSGQSVCHTIFVKNTSSTPLIVNSLYKEIVPQDFKVTAIPSLPIIILQNEIVSVFDICFTPNNSIDSVESGDVDIICSAASVSKDIVAYFTAKEIVDS